eukprot:CAMPEP_0184290142 /NCGR_PEP_ID=MMETSP1049-20130417/2485_1 /TAXON_ID=77928 /ORGANISM="Proteomonas sulcata, Strain CCMP704" /LENGTH=200 /DNA_ID=CAMNT_0026597223 /DNA_START=182 /DNA_END=784 /DNA_ORIENTATION=-
MSWLGINCCSCARARKGPNDVVMRTMDENDGKLSNKADVNQNALTQESFDELHEALEIAELEQALARVSLFGSLNPSELTKVAKGMLRQEYLDGEYIYRQGWPAETFFVITTGSVQKVVESGDGSKPGIPISEPLGAGACFGQNALVGDANRRSCSMKAVGRTEVRSMSRKELYESIGDLKRVLQRSPRLYKKYEGFFNA